jgi:hypothetical protein
MFNNEGEYVERPFGIALFVSGKTPILRIFSDTPVGDQQIFVNGQISQVKWLVCSENGATIVRPAFTALYSSCCGAKNDP